MSKEGELYSLLIPLVDERLLVPRACVAEVIAFAEQAEPIVDDSPEWFLGSVDWNGRRLPVVSLDAARGEPSPSRRSRRRIVVFHGLTEHMRGRYYGVLTQGFPQLVRVNKDVLTVDPEGSIPADKPVICRARMIHDYALIPDVERLERLVASLDDGANKL
jgi:chemosensory pili system protein ChpC